MEYENSSSSDSENDTIESYTSKRKKKFNLKLGIFNELIFKIFFN